jgi:C1A family cysteine protease
MALIANGPCVGVLPVYNSDSNDEFWNKRYGNLEGYHAVAIVGYCKDGFIIRNSWGERYGEDGYTLLKNKDFCLFRELWTIY